MFNSFEEKINTCNLKRKINDNDDDVIPQIVSDYRKKFCFSLDRSALEWKFDLKETYLHDKSRNRDCLVISQNNCAFIQPDGKKVKPYRNQWTPKTLPVLTNDALRCIFKHISPWELLNLRFVCKKWNQIIVNTRSFWVLRGGIENNTMKGYIHHMFLNVKNESQITEFLFKNPELFFQICRTVLGQDRYKGRLTKYKLMFGNYILKRKSEKNELICGSCKIKIQNFLEVYRQKICMHLPTPFQIRD
jgi:hypothetical protein